MLLYHGAALSNLVFATSQVCVIEFAAPNSFESGEPSMAWCDRMALWSHRIECNTHVLPLRQVLAANGHHTESQWNHTVSHTSARLRASYLLHLHKIGITLRDVESATRSLGSCLYQPERPPPGEYINSR